ncbi:uncharacterized protein LOC130655032 [Hydractinia symbiolongicarpus]|uniref:uncharacterized protein LOC130655032 n=1 Tax=Hydractinia symbiolongicarpus TaxID=13093 RepID=UPI00254E4B8F|nr:uncharacterized protein LOC130655032 [Hydractinia symbiolongicarpus]
MILKCNSPHRYLHVKVVMLPKELLLVVLCLVLTSDPILSQLLPGYEITVLQHEKKRTSELPKLQQANRSTCCKLGRSLAKRGFTECSNRRNNISRLDKLLSRNAGRTILVSKRLVRKCELVYSKYFAKCCFRVIQKDVIYHKRKATKYLLTAISKLTTDN